ncbi:MAG: protein-glutamate O-methyltransferase CheR [Mycobacteriales bacterium]
MTTSTDRSTAVVGYLEAALGLSFSGPRRTRLLAAIEAQRVASGLSPELFLDAVSRPGQVHDRLVAQVTVGETYFFRDRVQCDLLRALVLPELAARSGPEQSITLWSAGCASGEEPFTLAALAEEAGLGERCTVVGSDASGRALDKARRGTYGPWSMRSTTPAEQATHFRERDGHFQIAEQLRQRTRFVQRNLLNGPPPPGRFDVVLCRNLLIYLTREAVQRASAVLASALTQDGWLITAAGDPPLDAPGLEPVRTRYGLAYRRARAGLPGLPPPVSALQPATALPPAVSQPRSSARPGAPEAHRRRPAARPAHRSPARPPAPAAIPAPVPAATPATALAEQIRLLGDAGRVAEACRIAGDAAQAHPLDVELRYLAGVVLLEAGRLDEAAEAASSAVYLGPELAAAHLLLGQVEHARGNAERARRSFRNGSRLLAAAPDDAPVALVGDLPAGHLAAIAARYLSHHPAGG